MTNINSWMVSNKIAKNDFAANLNGLELSKLPRFWWRVWLVLCYREWRNSKAYKTTTECFAAALSSKRPAKLPLQGTGGSLQDKE